MDEIQPQAEPQPEQQPEPEALDMSPGEMVDGIRRSAVKVQVWPHDHKDEFRGPHMLRLGMACQPPVLRTWDTKKLKPGIFITQPTSEVNNFSLLRIAFLKPGASVPDDLVGKDEVFQKANVFRMSPMECPTLNEDLTPEDREAFRIAWKNARPTVLRVYIKAKITDKLPHPIPIGKWEGTLSTDDESWVLFTLQAVSLQVRPTEAKRNIILPGDADFHEPPIEYTRLP